MKKITIAILIVFMAGFTGCSAQRGLQTGMTLPDTIIIAGTKAPQINYQDANGTAHQLPSILKNQYTLIVFTGERPCADRDSILIETARDLYRTDAPATIVEIVGGNGGCKPVQKTSVLQRFVSDANLFTLCDISGDASRRYCVNDITSLYLIDPFGRILETAPYSELDTLLARTSHLSSELQNGLDEFYD